MPNPRIIDQYLRLTLVPAEGDEEVTKLNAVCGSVRETLNVGSGRAIRYTMVGMDPAISDADPTIREIDDIIQSQWPSFNNRYRGKAVNVARAAIADSLAAASKEKATVAAAVSLTARNVAPYVDLGLEASIWTTIVSDAEAVATAAVQQAWSLRPTTENQISYRSITADDLAQALRPGFGAASSPDGTAIAGTNTFNAAAVASWSETAAVLVGKALAEQISALALRNAQHTSEFVKREAAVQQALVYRSELLWWKESLYSSSLEAGYRTIGSALGAMTMAHDLAILCPRFAPRSVEWVLRESIAAAFGQKEKTQPISDHIETLIRDSRRGLLGGVWARREEPQGRRSLAQFIGELLRGEIGLASLQEVTGIAASQPMTIGDVASIAYRGLQAQ